MDGKTLCLLCTLSYKRILHRAKKGEKRVLGGLDEHKRDRFVTLCNKNLLSQNHVKKMRNQGTAYRNHFSFTAGDYTVSLKLITRTVVSDQKAQSCALVAESKKWNCVCQP